MKKIARTRMSLTGKDDVKKRKMEKNLSYQEKRGGRERERSYFLLTMNFQVCFNRFKIFSLVKMLTLLGNCNLSNSSYHRK